MTAATMLRAAFDKGVYQHGHRRSMKDYIMLDHYVSYNSSSFHWTHTFEQYSAMQKLHARYRRMCWFLKEVKPNWREVRRIGYADNSTYAVEVNDRGEERERMICGPGGDVCF